MAASGVFRNRREIEESGTFFFSVVYVACPFFVSSLPFFEFSILWVSRKNLHLRKTLFLTTCTCV